MEKRKVKEKRENFGVRKFPCLREALQQGKITLLLVPCRYDKTDQSLYSTFHSPHSALQKGFTLIEIIMVIILAGLAISAIVIPFVTGIRGSTKPEMVAKSMFLAQQKMEEFTKYNYGNAALNPVALTAYVNSGVPNYDWQWEIVYVDSNFNTSGSDVGYKRIIVRVRDPESSTYEVYVVVTYFP
jgi:prepilin-type N-terminal cleavage/methylation domain-containing protein